MRAFTKSRWMRLRGTTRLTQRFDKETHAKGVQRQPGGEPEERAGQGVHSRHGRSGGMVSWFDLEILD